MSTYTIKSYDQIVSDMTAYILANASQITDLSPGSIILAFCQASALSIEELYVAVYLGFQRALTTVGPDKFDFARKTGTEAQGNVEFYASSSPTSAVTIPSGTRVQTSAGLTYATTADATIASGAASPFGSGSVPVAAQKVGAIYNVAGTATLTMVDNVNGVSSVAWYNSVGPTQGTDAESDFQYQSRFQSYIEGLAGSNKAGLRAAALSISGVTSASVQEYFPAVSNVNANVWIDNGSSSGAPGSLVASVQNIIDGDGTAANPGYRSAGVNVVAVAAGVVPIDVTVTVVRTSTNVASDIIQTDITDAITAYVSTLGVAEDVTYFAISSAILSVYGVASIYWSSPTTSTLLVNGAQQDVTISSGQVGRVNSVTTTVQ